MGLCFDPTHAPLDLKHLPAESSAAIRRLHEVHYFTTKPPPQLSLPDVNVHQLIACEPRLAKTNDGFAPVLGQLGAPGYGVDLPLRLPVFPTDDDSSEHEPTAPEPFLLNGQVQSTQLHALAHPALPVHSLFWAHSAACRWKASHGLSPRPWMQPTRLTPLPLWGWHLHNPTMSLWTVPMRTSWWRSCTV